jgi:hypothetical protein
VRTVLPGGVLDALGILKNPVPVEALYDPDAARRHTLKNLLQRAGYEDLDAVVDRGRLVEARAALRRVLARRKLSVTPEDEARIDHTTDLDTLARWHDAAIDASSAIDALR